LVGIAAFRHEMGWIIITASTKTPIDGMLFL